MYTDEIENVSSRFQYIFSLKKGEEKRGNH
jgi:hypothetical protein